MGDWPNYITAKWYALLDEEFDAPDAAADADLCRAIAAGRWGLHPDAWGSYETMRISGADFDQRNSRYYHPIPVDPAWEAEHRRRPVEEHKPQAPPREDTVLDYGWLQLDCDDCGVKFQHTLRYPAGLRPAYVVAVRAQAREVGWTCIVGHDRCPKCSTVLPSGGALEEAQPLDLGTQLDNVPEHGP
jgi:hypothetical protein